jgi:hypothetical protein
MSDLTQPLDKRSRAAHPEQINVGDEVFVRNDLSAAAFGESERSHNRRDRDGAPYEYFGNVKYRPQKRFADFILSGIKQQPALAAKAKHERRRRRGEIHKNQEERQT